MALSKEQMLQRIDALAEKRRRLLRAKPKYRPNPGQAKLHKSEANIRFSAAGNGGGKTAAAVQEAWWWATGVNPVMGTKTKVPARIVVLLDAPKKVKDIWLPELRFWFNLDAECELKRNGKPYVEEIVFKNGSSITFYFHLQEEMIFEGVQLDYLICDEPPPRHAWVGLKRGMRRLGFKPKTIIIGTPIGQPWLHQEIWEPAERGEREDVEIFRWTTYDNEINLAEGFIEDFERNLTEKEKRIRLLGEWGHLEGYALAHLFKEETHVMEPIDWPNRLPVTIAIDPHPAKNHVASMVGADSDGNLYYIKELSSKAPPREFARKMREWMAGYKVIDIVCDSMGSAPTSGGDGNKSFIQVLQSEGIKARPTSFKEKSDEAFIDKIRQVLELPLEKDNFGRSLPKLRIFKGNEGIIKDIKYVTWLKHRHLDVNKDKLDIQNKDYLATLKYNLATIITSNQPRLPRTTRFVRPKSRRSRSH